MSERIKCIVKDCGNHTNEGNFDGPLCFPCAQAVRLLPVRALIMARARIIDLKSKLEAEQKAIAEALWS